MAHVSPYMLVGFYRACDGQTNRAIFLASDID